MFDTLFVVLALSLGALAAPTQEGSMLRIPTSVLPLHTYATHKSVLRLLYSSSPLIPPPSKPSLSLRDVAVLTIVYRYCMIMPKDAHTDVGASEYLGGMTTYFSAEGRQDGSQGQFPTDLWGNVELKTATTANGKCIQRKSLLPLRRCVDQCG
jgi:hypothetical protein